MLLWEQGYARKSKTTSLTSGFLFPILFKEKSDDKKMIFVFICVFSTLKDSKFAVVDFSEILKCIDLNRIDKYKDNQSVKIKLIKRHRNFNIYGTNHPDKKDSSIKILVNNINGLI